MAVVAEAFRQTLLRIFVPLLGVSLAALALLLVFRSCRSRRGGRVPASQWVAICVVMVVCTLLSGKSTNGVNGVGGPHMMQTVQHPQLQPVPFVPPSVPRISAPSPRASADMPFRARAWNRRGAWDDSFRCAFPGEWVFPRGTGQLDRVEVCSQGRILPRYGSTNVIADVGVPLQIVNPLTSFGCGPTASNSYVFAWTNAAQECKV